MVRATSSHSLSPRRRRLAEGDVDLKQLPKAVLEAVEKYRELCDGHRYLDYTTIMDAATQESVATTQKTVIIAIILSALGAAVGIASVIISLLSRRA